MFLLRLCSATRKHRLDLRQTGRMNTSKFAPLCAAVLCLASCALLLSQRLSADAGKTHRSGLQPIERIVPYYDADYGFEVAVPERWSPVYAATHDEQVNEPEPGYAVGFESPRSHARDVFADYLMVEILPGAQTGAFHTDGSQSKVVMVDGRVAIVDRVDLDGFDIDGDRIDLVVFQAEIVELGFTIGIFAIGEQHEATVLADAFQLAIKTFKVPDDPFSVS